MKDLSKDQEVLAAMVVAVVVAEGATKEEIITLIWIGQRVSMVEGTLEVAVEEETGTLAVVVEEEEIIIATSGIMETGIIETEWITGTTTIITVEVVVVWIAWNVEEETISMVVVMVAAKGTFTNQGFVPKFCDLN